MGRQKGSALRSEEALGRCLYGFYEFPVGDVERPPPEDLAAGETTTAGSGRGLLTFEDPY
jgi:hypothetical protein